MTTAALIASLVLLLVQFVCANTEKTIFTAPHRPVPSSTDLASLCLPVLSPAQPAIRTELTLLPIGKEAVSERTTTSWYLLHQLNLGQRYETRVCWAANKDIWIDEYQQQPSEFWLDTFTVEDVFESPDLLSELTDHSTRQHESACPGLEALTETQSVLFLRLGAAANFYSTNKTLMRDPPPVGVDVILDPYLANVLPRSLAPTVAFIILVGICGWFLSGMIWQKLQAAAEVGGSKRHIE